MSKVKLERISAQIIRELNSILLKEVKNDELKSITITGAEVSGDLGVAKIYYTFLGDYEKDFVSNELKNASSFFRTQLAERLDIRHTPELRFKFDESIEYGTNIERILAEIKDK